MKTVVAVYTASALIEPIKSLFAELLPGVRLVNLLDDSLIPDVIRDNEVLLPVSQRLLKYYQACADLGADAILNTCSSIGDVAEAARRFLGVPLLRIDEPMARRAVELSSRIAVLATLPTTLAPTKRLVLAIAKLAGKKVEVVEGLAAGAFQALVGGRPEEHDRILRAAAEKAAAQAEIIVLAQGSMARMEQELAGLTGKQVLSSPRSGVLAVKSFLETRPHTC